jgi:NAD(P)-dependent dehydrogenase (short-subunit alcohol dehydrogenase family)
MLSASWDKKTDPFGVPLHVLVNNAGVLALPQQHTPEGWEMQFATNHLGHCRQEKYYPGNKAGAGGAQLTPQA